MAISFSFMLDDEDLYLVVTPEDVDWCVRLTDDWMRFILSFFNLPAIYFSLFLSYLLRISTLNSSQ